jgi:hypothetical protein
MKAEDRRQSHSFPYTYHRETITSKMKDYEDEGNYLMAQRFKDSRDKILADSKDAEKRSEEARIHHSLTALKAQEAVSTKRLRREWERRRQIYDEDARNYIQNLLVSMICVLCV